jgi:hypothetical protein
MVNVLTTLYCIILQIVRNVSHVDEANIRGGKTQEQMPHTYN